MEIHRKRITMKISSRRRGLLSAIVISSVFCIMAMASSVSAQQNACVHLKVGAGYAAKMRVCTGDTCKSWSGVFGIGKSKCQSLAGFPTGTIFTVQVHAQAGDTKTCSPSDVTRNANDKTNLVYLASGTTKKVHCNQP